jgi:hypothetical protein
VQIAREDRLARQEKEEEEEKFRQAKQARLKEEIERKVAEGNGRYQQANKPVFKDGLFNRIRFKK